MSKMSVVHSRDRSVVSQAVLFQRDEAASASDSGSEECGRMAFTAGTVYNRISRIHGDTGSVCDGAGEP